jgi:uncharacterized repeat protein (TIGR03803 family)
MTRKISTKPIATMILVFALLPACLAQTESVIYSFRGGTDGSQPSGSLTADHAGHLYGTTSSGGASNAGTVFALTSSAGRAKETVIHTFTGSDGSTPQQGLVIDAHGNLYGTTYYGGAYNNGGVVFELQHTSTGNWKEIVLHSFNYDGLTNFDGANPASTLVLDQRGNLYGTTFQGGSGTCFYNGPGSRTPKGNPLSGCGTVFELSPGPGGTWTETLLYNFQGGPDGGFPLAGLVFDRKGTLYGTTFEGGGGTNVGCGSYFDSGCGIVFSLTRGSGATWAENVLYTFQGQSDGGNPTSPLIFDLAGNLYGTTQGAQAGYAGTSTVFELSPSSGGSWAENTLYNFPTQGFGGGVGPYSGVTFDSAGNLYGTTYYGSSTDSAVAPPKLPTGGTAYKLTPSGGAWTASVLHFFEGTPDGFAPSYGNLFLWNGNLYGTTSGGGASGNGTVFKVVP